MKRSFDLAAMPDHAFVRLADPALILGVCPRTLRNWRKTSHGPTLFRNGPSLWGCQAGDLKRALAARLQP